jgi:hypothetical protein
VAEGDQVGGALGGLDGGDSCGAEDFAFGDFGLGDGFEGGGGEGDKALGDGAAGGDGLGADVDHGGLAFGVEVGELWAMGHGWILEDIEGLGISSGMGWLHLATKGYTFRKYVSKR